MLTSLIALLSITSCQSDVKEKEKLDEYLVTRPYICDTMTTREYVGQIRAISHIELRALEKGYLQGIFVDEGQFVKQGTLMFQIMPLMYKAERQKAQAEADFAEIEYKMAKMLADSNVVSKTQMALVKAKYEKAKAELALADVHLSFTEIRAPFDGLMDRFQVRLGSLLDEGDLLSTLSDNSKMWVYFNVPEAEYLDFKAHEKKGNKMKVKLLMANQ